MNKLIMVAMAALLVSSCTTYWKNPNYADSDIQRMLNIDHAYCTQQSYAAGNQQVYYNPWNTGAGGAAMNAYNAMKTAQVDGDRETIYNGCMAAKGWYQVDE